MGETLPFEAAWIQAALCLARLRTALESTGEQAATHAPEVGLAIVLGGATIVAGQVFYNIYLHPLRRFPGPFLARATGFWRVWKLVSGDLPHTVKDLHKQHGPVIRIAPYELAFTDSQAWKDIYGHQTSYEMVKDDKFYKPMGTYVPDSIITAGRADHSMLRRQLAHGFSERSMRAQEPIFRKYVDLLVQRLEEHSSAGGGKVPLDMRAWFNYTTFDVIGNLSFGSDFGCLEESNSHPWVDAITSNLRDNSIMRAMTQLIPPGFVYLLDKSGVFKGRKKHIGYTKKRMHDRMQLEAGRPDFIEGLLKKRDVLSVQELELNAALLVIAGSETTATLLSGAFYLMGTHRHVLDKVVQEVRSAFSSEDEIDLISVNRLDYMLACLKESLRQYPPAPLGFPRVTPKGGVNIAGHYVPEGTSVSIWQLAASYSPRNFAEPEEFRPERFLGDPEFAGDDLKATQPFSTGPRNCIGMNLAYAEMRLICARILYKFDIELAPEARGWIARQKIYALWDKPSLPVYLTPAATAA